MIISGLQTGNTRWLAAHLQNAADNETIEIAEVSGTVATDIDGALAEFDAITAGTKAREGVYAAFINPPVPLSREQYMRAIALLEERLGLAGQPRIILFHTKNGREHCHIVWSRVDWRAMKAIHLSHDRQKLRRCAQELAAEFGTPLPPGLTNDRGAERFKDPPQPTRAEKAMEAASGLAREDRRRVITDCYRNSDTPEAFVNALEAAGFMLARGDKRVFVVVDIAGDVHALARQIDGAKTKDVKKKLEGLTLSLLPPASRAKVLMLQRAAALEDVRRADVKKKAAAEGERDRLTAVQRKRRAALDLLWQQMKIRHMHEWKVLLAHIQAEKEHKIARRHWLAVGLAIYLKKIAFIRQLLEYYEERRKRTVEEQHRALMESVRLRHDNEAAELRRRYAALARLERREEWTYLQRFGEIADADDFGFARATRDLLITYESTYQYDYGSAAFRQNAADMAIAVTDELIDLHKELAASHGAETVGAVNSMSDFHTYAADEQWTMFRQNTTDMTEPATTVRFIDDDETVHGTPTGRGPKPPSPFWPGAP